MKKLLLFSVFSWAHASGDIFKNPDTIKNLVINRLVSGALNINRKFISSYFDKIEFYAHEEKHKQELHRINFLNLLKDLGFKEIELDLKSQPDLSKIYKKLLANEHENLVTFNNLKTILEEERKYPDPKRLKSLKVLIEKAEKKYHQEEKIGIFQERLDALCQKIAESQDPKLKEAFAELKKYNSLESLEEKKRFLKNLIESFSESENGLKESFELFPIVNSFFEKYKIEINQIFYAFKKDDLKKPNRKIENFEECFEYVKLKNKIQKFLISFKEELDQNEDVLDWLEERFPVELINENCVEIFFDTLYKKEEKIFLSLFLLDNSHRVSYPALNLIMKKISTAIMLKFDDFWIEKTENIKYFTKILRKKIFSNDSLSLMASFFLKSDRDSRLKKLENHKNRESSYRAAHAKEFEKIEKHLKKHPLLVLEDEQELTGFEFKTELEKQKILKKTFDLLESLQKTSPEDPDHNKSFLTICCISKKIEEIKEKNSIKEPLIVNWFQQKYTSIVSVVVDGHLSKAYRDHEALLKRIEREKISLPRFPHNPSLTFNKNILLFENEEEAIEPLNIGDFYNFVKENSILISSRFENYLDESNKDILAEKARHMIAILLKEESEESKALLKNFLENTCKCDAGIKEAISVFYENFEEAGYPSFQASKTPLPNIIEEKLTIAKKSSLDLEGLYPEIQRFFKSISSLVFAFFRVQEKWFLNLAKYETTKEITEPPHSNIYARNLFSDFLGAKRTFDPQSATVHKTLKETKRSEIFNRFFSSVYPHLLNKAKTFLNEQPKHINYFIRKEILGNSCFDHLENDNTYFAVFDAKAKKIIKRFTFEESKKLEAGEIFDDYVAQDGNPKEAYEIHLVHNFSELDAVKFLQELEVLISL